jgi:hypothetical protein
LRRPRRRSRIAPELFNFGDDLRAFFFAAAGQNDLCASASEFDRGSLADTGCTSVTSATLPENVLLFMLLLSLFDFGKSS